MSARGLRSMEYLPYNYFFFVWYNIEWKDRLAHISRFIQLDRVDGHLSNDVEIDYSTYLHSLHPAHRKPNGDLEDFPASPRPSSDSIYEPQMILTVSSG